MRAAETLEYHLLLLEPDDHGRIIALIDAGNLHHCRHIHATLRDIPDFGHAALMDLAAYDPAIEINPRLQPHTRHFSLSDPALKPKGQ